MSLLTRDYDYTLPDELIARRPLAQRAAARMMVLHRAEQRIEHRHFIDFPSYVESGDLVVLNNTKVIPARAFSDDGKSEMLFLEPLGENLWKCLVKPGRRLRAGREVRLGGVTGCITDVLPTGERLIQFAAPVDLERYGHLPIPPYLERESDAGDTERYQTVYAATAGAVAAPTAGLHFTPEILAQVSHAFLTLHVGTGTFRPVQVEDVREHVMHTERFAIDTAAAAQINAARRRLAVGTTTTRVLESCRQRAPEIRAQNGATNIFIYPPFRFQSVDLLLTNFHLPKSTLLMLVCALAGREFTLRAYAEAIEARYRFYSYGDCMLIC